MGNTPKAKTATSRREALEAVQRQQRAAERRRTTIMVVVAAVVGVLIVAAVAVPSWVSAQNDPKKKAISSFGVSAAEAQCSAPITAPATGAGQHVDPGTVVKYASAPPMFGTHDGQFITDPRHFYSDRDRPPVEKLVHSLEHGYTIVWYDDTVSGAQLEALKGLAVRMPEAKNPGRWFMVAPWTAADAKTRGSFPQGKHVALTHWSAKTGTRLYCGKVSGEVVEKFVGQHPATDAPEPGGV